ncbi:hypothetical protein PCASD_22343 [Puccinia coronata f. sp. avenae]|uniref:Uncharacterized protein n=1 Tax=Puccinia coronata f. sp. avenae TaxID=200324 RepID=A0A2N5U8D9_9BASI|nr:hypothetical protein PCASD_22343 [Puccinia coronata f. sp. avenae]
MGKTRCAIVPKREVSSQRECFALYLKKLVSWSAGFRAAKTEKSRAEAKADQVKKAPGISWAVGGGQRGREVAGTGGDGDGLPPKAVMSDEDAQRRVKNLVIELASTSFPSTRASSVKPMGSRDPLISIEPLNGTLALIQAL